MTYAGNPPVNAVNQMIEVANLVGYTKEMLMEDADQFSFTVSFTEPAVFDLSLEITLEDGDLLPRICRQGIWFPKMITIRYRMWR